MTKPVWVSRDKGPFAQATVFLQDEKPECDEGVYNPLDEELFYMPIPNIAAERIGLNLSPGECRQVVFDCRDASEPSRAELAEGLRNLIVAFHETDEGLVIWASAEKAARAILARVKGGEA